MRHTKPTPRRPVAQVADPIEVAVISPRDLGKLQRREQILDAAERVFAEVGMAACTMDQVARAADISRPLLYVYFRDKQALQQGIGVRALEQLLERFQRAGATEKLGLRKLLAIGKAYIAFAREEPNRFAVLSMCEAQAAEPQSDDPLAHAMMEAGLQVHRETARVLQAGIDDGSIRPDLIDLDMVSKTLWALVHGSIQLAQTKRGVIEADGGSVDSFFNCSMEFAMQALMRKGKP